MPQLRVVPISSLRPRPCFGLQAINLSMLWLPATAISSTRRVCVWPSAKECLIGAAMHLAALSPVPAIRSDPRISKPSKRQPAVHDPPPIASSELGVRITMQRMLPYARRLSRRSFARRRRSGSVYNLSSSASVKSRRSSASSLCNVPSCAPSFPSSLIQEDSSLSASGNFPWSSSHGSLKPRLRRTLEFSPSPSWSGNSDLVARSTDNRNIVPAALKQPTDRHVAPSLKTASISGGKYSGGSTLAASRRLT